MRARFEFSQRRFERKGESEEEQREDWLEEHPLETRRPALHYLMRGDALVPLLKGVMTECWADAVEARPPFAKLVDFLESVRHSKLSAATSASEPSTPMTSPTRTHNDSFSVENLAAFKAEIIDAVLAGKESLAGLIISGNRQAKIDRQQLHDEEMDALHELKSSVDRVSTEISNHSAAIEAGQASIRRLMVRLCGESAVPTRFAVFPDTQGTRGWFKSPKTWLKKPYRLHLLCDGNHAAGIEPHFLFANDAELATCPGYQVLQPTEKLRKWGPAIRFALGTLSLVAKAA
eukprot:UC1_evm1s644